MHAPEPLKCAPLCVHGSNPEAMSTPQHCLYFCIEFRKKSPDVYDACLSQAGSRFVMWCIAMMLLSCADDINFVNRSLCWLPLLKHVPVNWEVLPGKCFHYTQKQVVVDYVVG